MQVRPIGETPLPQLEKWPIQAIVSFLVAINLAPAARGCVARRRLAISQAILFGARHADLRIPMRQVRAFLREACPQRQRPAASLPRVWRRGFAKGVFDLQCDGRCPEPCRPLWRNGNLSRRRALRRGGFLPVLKSAWRIRRFEFADRSPGVYIPRNLIRSG